MLTRDQYDAKHAELLAMRYGDTVLALDGTLWRREWTDMWTSDKPIKVNSLALVSEFNQTETKQKDKRAELGGGLFS